MRLSPVARYKLFLARVLLAQVLGEMKQQKLKGASLEDMKSAESATQSLQSLEMRYPSGGAS